MLNVKPYFGFVFSLSLIAISFLETPWQENAFAAGMTEGTVSENGTKLGFAYLKPPSKHKWQLKGVGGTDKGAKLVHTDVSYSPTATLDSRPEIYVRVTEEDIPGAVSVEDYYRLYTRTPRHPSQPNPELAKLLAYVKKDNLGSQKNGTSIKSDTLKNVIILQGSFRYGSFYHHRKEIWYLTTPSPYKTKTAVFVMLSYDMDTTSSSSAAIDKMVADDMSNSVGLYQSYLRKYPNRINY